MGKLILCIPSIERDCHVANVLQELGVQTTVSNREVVEANEVVYVAVKPNTVGQVLDDVAPVITNRTLIVSIAAGITINSMQKVNVTSVCCFSIIDILM